MFAFGRNDPGRGRGNAKGFASGADFSGKSLNGLDLSGSILPTRISVPPG